MIRVETENSICTITLDRPEKANALTGEMLAKIANAVEAASVDPSVKAVFLTGSGKVFSAGADLKAVQAGLATDTVWERLSGAIASCPVLTIAVLNGTVAGGAMGMVLACDIRISRAETKFFYPVMKLGVLPQPSDPKRLATLIGPARAKTMLVGGKKVSAEDASRWGLIDEISDTPLTAAKDMVAGVLNAERDHSVAIKALFE